MFSIFHGTALDTSLLIDHLGSYIFHGPDSPGIDQHLVLGTSLGGHAAWQVFFNERRVTAAIIIIGCPDYMRKSLCVWGLWDSICVSRMEILSSESFYNATSNRHQLT